MARTISSVKVLNTKHTTTVYVNFSDGTFGTRTRSDGKWVTKRMTPEELAEAARLAKKNGKWTNWKAPAGDKGSEMNNVNNKEFPDKEIRLIGTGTVKYTVDVQGTKVRLQNHSLELWHITEWQDGWYPHDTLIYRVRAGNRIIEGIGTSFETAGNDLEDKLQALGWQDIKF